MSQQDQTPIPDKRYFTIGEVSGLCGVKPHVLRYWEQEFPTLKPTKRRGNRRYYQKKDVILVRQIKNLLYRKGFTIEGARSQLSKGESAETTAYGFKEFLNNLSSNLEQLLGELNAQGESGA